MRLALRRRYPSTYDHERSGIHVRPGLAVIALLAAAAIGWMLRGGTPSATRAVTRTVTTLVTPPTVYRHTPAGAAATAQAFLYARAVAPATGPLAVTNPRAGEVSGVWHLLYRVKSYSPQAATIRTWGLDLSYGYGSASLTWGFTDVDVQWNGTRWTPTANPVTIVPEGATPPSNNTTGSADRSFGALLYPFRRFAGAP